MSLKTQDAYIVAALRTAVGKAPRGVFKHVRPDDLLAHVIQGAMAKIPEVDKQQINDVIIGCAMPESEQGMNVARIGLLLAHLPNTVPGVTINRFCASGLQSIAMAHDRIATGQADMIIAGGVESMSRVPMGGNRLSANPAYFTESEENVGIAYGMGITAEKVAQKWQVTREEQDQFALQSHQKALMAQEKNWFKEEILPYLVSEEIPDLAKGQIKEIKKEISKDEGPRAGTSLEALAHLKSVFALKGTVTAGNSSQMSDGAAALVLVSEKILKQYNLKPLAQLKSYALSGVAPELMGIGPALAIPKALEAADLKLEDLSWIELNEAFAAQSLAVIKELHLDPSKVNPEGGAIALGHPLGATGSIRAATLIHGLRRERKSHGMVTMCIGTGMGAAGIFEVF